MTWMGCVRGTTQHTSTKKKQGDRKEKARTDNCGGDERCAVTTEVLWIEGGEIKGLKAHPEEVFLST